MTSPDHNSREKTLQSHYLCFAILKVTCNKVSLLEGPTILSYNSYNYNDSNPTPPKQQDNLWTIIQINE